MIVVEEDGLFVSIIYFYLYMYVVLLLKYDEFELFS